MAEFTSGQWVRIKLKAKVAAMNGDCTIEELDTADLPKMHADGQIGLWYPKGKNLAGFVKPVPCDVVYPLDPENGMPLDWGGGSLCFAADSVGPVKTCKRKDLPQARAKHMDEADFKRFVGD